MSVLQVSLFCPLTLRTLRLLLMARPWQSSVTALSFIRLLLRSSTFSLLFCFRTWPSDSASMWPKRFHDSWSCFRVEFNWGKEYEWQTAASGNRLWAVYSTLQVCAWLCYLSHLQPSTQSCHTTHTKRIPAQIQDFNTQIFGFEREETDLIVCNMFETLTHNEYCQRRTSVPNISPRSSPPDSQKLLWLRSSSVTTQSSWGKTKCWIDAQCS